MSIFHNTIQPPVSFRGYKELQLAMMSSSMATTDRPLSESEATGLPVPPSAPSQVSPGANARKRDVAIVKAFSQRQTFPTILELWISWAGQTLWKKCRTVNVFHMECVIRTVLSLTAESDFRMSTGDAGENNSFVDADGPRSTGKHHPASAAKGGAGQGILRSKKKHQNGELIAGATHDAADDEDSDFGSLRSVVGVLQRDVIAFRDAIGTQVEVMAPEALSILRGHTVLLHSWLTSPSATNMQEELNALIQYAFHVVREEDRVRSSKAAAADLQAMQAHQSMRAAGSSKLTRRKSLLSFRKAASKD
jgi:hypothetical protein